MGVEEKSVFTIDIPLLSCLSSIKGAGQCKIFMNSGSSGNVVSDASGFSGKWDTLNS